MPNCSMFELIYVFRNTKFIFLACNDSIVDFEDRYLNILKGIIISSAPESILYISLVFLWLVLDSNLVSITDLTLSRLMYFTFTTSKLQSCSSHFVRLVSPLLHHINCLFGLLVPQLCLWGSADCLEMVIFATFPTFLLILRALPTHMSYPTCHCLRYHVHAFVCFARRHPIP